MLFATPTVDGKKHIELDLAKQLVQKSAVRYDKEGDEHYDIVSAYQRVCVVQTGRCASLSCKAS